ncbi:Uma2 family endonuclease [Catellatospora methionotrophica]|uniref:Uma2 family endonuclease n=1 Tax=Catellatospora methionotrophica TaxID=121620 RepID=UPI00340915EC
MTRPSPKVAQDGAHITLPSAVTVTPDEYDALPPDPRIELVDGVLHVMTPPTARHQIVMMRLVTSLLRRCPEHLTALHEQEIRLADDHRRNPDVLVVRRDAVNLDWFSFPPKAVLLAVEIVSPGTQTADRKHKPAEYADAGIPCYWRIEPLPELAVHTYQLDETDVYESTGVFHPGDHIAVPRLPWATIPIIDLTP